MTRQSGRVHLVGAGPGDPGLITLRGLECLREADLVLYDGLVNPLLLRHARGLVERTARTTRPGVRCVAQANVTARMIEAAQAGQVVVRLKGGDPFIFGRGGEEAADLARAGIPYEVVPGITAATAAAVYAGISLTHRDHASAVALITGHENPEKPERSLDYGALAKFPGTLVFYMGLHKLEAIAQALIGAGKPHDTPAAVICQTTLPHQQVVAGTLADIADRARAAKVQPPSLIVVGAAAGAREPPRWFDDRPLRGVSIALTRSAEQQDDAIELALRLGAEPVVMPLIDIGPPQDWSDVDAALGRIGEFDWLVFTSANGVRSCLGRLWDGGGDARALSGVRVAAIGPATARALEEFRLRADLVPESFRAEELADALEPHVHGRHVLWARANSGRDVLPDALSRAGAKLEQVVVYRNEDVAALPEGVAERIARGELDWIALSSPSIARNLARLAGSLLKSEAGRRVRLAAISPVTAEAAAAEGLEVFAVATEFNWSGLFDAIVSASAVPPA
ncbi:MAG: uroporphyrinogen-III C-methyltransferase [Planctomyces sp.]|nr:uroporphyrinogen-III C-methyltransferase [Planctomyces sp.]